MSQSDSRQSDDATKAAGNCGFRDGRQLITNQPATSRRILDRASRLASAARRASKSRRGGTPVFGRQALRAPLPVRFTGSAPVLKCVENLAAFIGAGAGR